MTKPIWDRHLEKAEKPPIIQHVNESQLDVSAYLSAHGCEVLKESSGPGGSILYCLNHCVFDPNHTPNEAAIGQQPGGKLFYQCFHDSCQDRTWQDARQLISGNRKLGPWMIGGNGQRKRYEGIKEHQATTGAKQSENRTSKPRFQFVHNAEIQANLKPTEWRIRDSLVDNSLYYDFGDPGTFKTFGEIDRGLCIAAGIDYHGHSVKQGTVFYIAGEGQQGIGRRIAAWMIYQKIKAQDVPFFVAKTPTQLMDPDALDEVRRAVDALAKEYGPPAVLHIDTLARNFGDGDENATKDMNRVIQNMDMAFGNDFCRGLTHHTGHTNKDRARGSIALHGAADAAFRFSLTASQQVLVECTKMKDAPNAPAMLFNLNEIKLIIGDQYDQSYVFSLAAEGDEAAAAKTGSSNFVKISGSMKKALSLLDKMYAEYEKNLSRDDRQSTPKVAISDWRDACIEKKCYQTKPNFNRALESMRERKLVHFDENNVHIYSVSIYAKYFNKEANSDE